MNNSLPFEWELVKLSDEIETPIAGSRPKGGVSEDSGEIPSIGAEFITSDGQLDFKGMKFVNLEFYQSMKSGKLEVNDVLICKDGALTGKVAFYKEKYFDDAAVNEHVFILRPKKEMNPKYIFYVLQSDKGQNQLKRIMTGSAQPGINTQFGKYFELLLPPKQEQDKITAILTNVDENIEITNDIIKENEKIKMGLMQQLLFNGFPNQHNTLKESLCGNIPKDWKCVSISDVAKLQGGFAFKSKDQVEDGARWLKIANVSREAIIWNVKSYLPENYLESYKDFILYEKDIIVAMTRPILNYKLKIARMKKKDTPALLNQRVGRFILKDNINSEYFFQLMKTHYFVKEIMLKIAGSDPPNMSSKQVESIMIPLPPIMEQDSIAKILEDADTRILLEKKKKIQLQIIKKGLMQKLLTGQIRVKVD